jgi:biotin transport system permease protein
MSAARLIEDFDARVKVLLTLVLGILTWQTGPAGLAIYGAALLLAAAKLSGRHFAYGRAVRAYLAFAALWTALKFALDLSGGVGAQTALQNSALLGARLGVILLLGLTLARSTSPRRMGLALSWLLRPLLGQRAWKAALAMSLMVHYLPLAYKVSDGVAEAFRIRSPRIPGLRKLGLFGQALIRTLSTRTWTQTVALAARGLDGPDAWRTKYGAGPAPWLAGLFLALGAFLAAGL